MRYMLLMFALCLAVPTVAAAQSSTRGKYIVERIGMCQDCHTPRGPAGQLIVSQGLHGAPIGLKPINFMPWAEYVPPLAGLPANFSADQLVAFLQTGKRPDGSLPRPPMPQYRMSREDAQAVTAYLRSLR